MRGDGAKKPFRLYKRFFLSMLFLSKKRKSIGPAQRPRPFGLEYIQRRADDIRPCKQHIYPLEVRRRAVGDAGPYKPDPDPEEEQRRTIRASPLRENI